MVRLSSRNFGTSPTRLVLCPIQKFGCKTPEVICRQVVLTSCTRILHVVKALGSIVSVFWVLAAIVLSIGCEASRSDVSVSGLPGDSAKADFDWAMIRLRRAIEKFTPPANHGLRVKRKLSYELIPPDTSQPDYTARVTVESHSAYQPKPGRFSSATEDEREASIPQADRSAFDEELVAARENDPTVFQEDYSESSPQKAVIVDPLVNAPSIKERIVYELIYRDNRWQLETQPDSKHEKMWFEYALQ